MLSALSLDGFVMGWSGEDALLTEAAAGFPGHEIVILHKAESYDGMSEGCPPGKKPFGSFRLVVLTDVPRVSIDKGVALFCGRRGRLSQGTEGEERHKTDPLRRKFAGQRDGPGKPNRRVLGPNRPCFAWEGPALVRGRIRRHQISSFILSADGRRDAFDLRA